MEKTPLRKKVKLAILEREVIASSKTNSKIYNDAKQFAVSAKSVDEFNTKAQENGYIVRPIELQKSTERVAAIPQSRQIVRWAFENKKGEVSDVFDCGNQFIVAINTEIKEKGYRALESVSQQIKNEIIKEKKGDILTKNIGEQAAKVQSLDQLAAAMNTEVKEAKSVSFNSYQFGMSGYEPAVLGSIQKQDKDKLSKPIKGNSGVYVINVLDSQLNESTFDEKMEKAQIESRLSQSMPYQIMQELKSKANIVDNRLTFY